MGPIRSSRWDRNVMKRKKRVCNANSVGPIAYFGETEIIAIGNREFAIPSR